MPAGDTMPRSQLYLVVDTRKCVGCIACMLACSLVHEGRVCPSLSRIQVIQSTWGRFPQDISIAVCRQCADAECVKACPTGSLHVDGSHGNVRVVDAALCNGCRSCLDACPHSPGRIVWNHDTDIAMKCDLCADTAFWRRRDGQEDGQACVAVCPVRAIRVVTSPPEETGGYEVNLRNAHWGWLGYPTD